MTFSAPRRVAPRSGRARSRTGSAGGKYGADYYTTVEQILGNASPLSQGPSGEEMIQPSARTQRGLAGTRASTMLWPPHRSPQRRSKASPSPRVALMDDHPTKGAMTTVKFKHGMVRPLVALFVGVVGFPSVTRST